MGNITGIDDIGTMSAKSEGWCYFSIPESLKSEFIDKSKKILSESKLKSFHGKEFKRKKVEYYKDFLCLIKNTLIKSDDTLLACTILSEKWKAEYIGFCTRLIEKSYSSTNINITHLIKTSSKLASPIFTFMRLAEKFKSTCSSIVEIDENSILRNFPGQTITAGDQTIDGSIPIYAASEAYRKRVFPNSPVISKSGIFVLRDEDSFFIQAADLFGNFSLSYAFKCLGKESKSNDLKSKIFAEVFKELATPERIVSALEISGDDLVLKDDGAFTVMLTTT